jgi:hypothetical protein
VGLLLVIIPWSSFWERNYFGEVVPLIRELLTNNYLRGGVTGLGLVNVWLALGDLSDVLASYRAASAPHRE